MLNGDEFTYALIQYELRTKGFKEHVRQALQQWPSSAPGPLRVGYVALATLFGKKVSGFRRLSRIGCALAMLGVGVIALRLSDDWLEVSAMLVVAGFSPLLWHLTARCLPDVMVAACQLAAFGLLLSWTRTGDWFQLTGAFFLLFLLVAMRESSIAPTVVALAVTMLLGNNTMDSIVVCALGAGAVALWLALLLVSGMKLRWFRELLRRQLRQGDTPYTWAYQTGAWHRLIVDLLLLSPLPVLVALLGAESQSQVRPVMMFAAVLLATHIGLPLRNVRTVLAVDLLVRMVAGVVLVGVAREGGTTIVLVLREEHTVSFSAFAVVFGVLFLASDVRTWARVFRGGRVYDPVTANLVRALGMAPD